MQTTALKSSDLARHAHVVRIRRSPTREQSQKSRVVLSASVHKPLSKWTVVVASILAVALHAGPVVWVEMQQTKPTLKADAPVLIHSVEEVFETGTGTDTAGAGGAKNAAD